MTGLCCRWTTIDENGIWWIGFFSDRYQNDSPSFLLVKDFTGSVGDDLDTDDGGIIDVEPWFALVDIIAVNKGSSHITYRPTILYYEYDGLPYAQGGAARIPDRYDIESITNWVRNDWDLAGITGKTGSPVLGEAYNTPGELNMIVTANSYLSLIMKYSFRNIEQYESAPPNGGQIFLFKKFLSRDSKD